MSHIAGTPLGAPVNYRGHEIVLSFYGPDMLAYVDSGQVGDFWIDVASADAGAKRYIDRLIEEREKKNAKGKR
jgi:hypothetical protein